MGILESIGRWSRDWGVRLAAIMGGAGGLLTYFADPQFVAALLAALPEGAPRLLAAGAISVAVFGVPTLTQILQDRLANRGATDTLPSEGHGG